MCSFTSTNFKVIQIYLYTQLKPPQIVRRSNKRKNYTYGLFQLPDGSSFNNKRSLLINKLSFFPLPENRTF